MFRRRRFRSRRVREARQRKRVRALVLTGVLVASVLFMLSQASKLPALRIDTVEVIGNKAVSGRVIYDTIKERFSGNHLLLFSRRNVFLFSRNRIEQGLIESFSRLKEVKVHTEGTHRVIVEVSERQMVGVVCAQEDAQCLFVDEDGYMFARAPQFSGDGFFRYYDVRKQKFLVGTHFLGSDTFGQVLRLQGALRELDLQPTTMLIGSENNAGLAEHFTFTLWEGTELIFSADIEKLEGELQRLQTVLLSDAFKEETDDHIDVIEYIDLRFGNKVFYRLIEEEF